MPRTLPRRISSRLIHRAHNSPHIQKTLDPDCPACDPSLYEPLAFESSIRFLTLRAASSKETQIACTLEVHDLAKGIPKYVALSYVWGPAFTKAKISVNGQQFDVSPNLFEALRHIRRRHSDLVVWIDAICINQADILERNHQVALMRRIYSGADYVIAWLGAATPDLDWDEPDAVVRDLASRTYWSRVWIIQEFVLGRAVVLQCGDMCLRCEDLDWLSEPPAVESLQMINIIIIRKFYSCNTSALTLANALAIAYFSNATDVRDKVYGILGLFNSHQVLKRLKPDYNLSPCEVFCLAIRAVREIESNGSSSTMEGSSIISDSDPQVTVDRFHDRASCDGKCGSGNLISLLHGMRYIGPFNWCPS